MEEENYFNNKVFEIDQIFENDEEEENNSIEGIFSDEEEIGNTSYSYYLLNSIYYVGGLVKFGWKTTSNYLFSENKQNE